MNLTKDPYARTYTQDRRVKLKLTKWAQRATLLWRSRVYVSTDRREEETRSRREEIIREKEYLGVRSFLVSDMHLRTLNLACFFLLSSSSGVSCDRRPSPRRSSRLSKLVSSGCHPLCPDFCDYPRNKIRVNTTMTVKMICFVTHTLLP